MSDSKLHEMVTESHLKLLNMDSLGVRNLSYEDEKREIPQLVGYDITTIKKAIEENSDAPCLNELGDEDLEALLYEMADMGILWSKPSSKLFRFRKNSFPWIIGSEDTVIETILLQGSEVSRI